MGPHRRTTYVGPPPGDKLALAWDPGGGLSGRLIEKLYLINNSMRARQMSSDSCFSRPVSTQSASHTLFLQDNFYSHNYYKYRKI